MADAVNVPVDSSNKSGLYLYPVCTLGAIALVLVVGRIYTRLRRTRILYIDDWLIIAAEVRQATASYVRLLNVNADSLYNRHSHCHSSSNPRLGQADAHVHAERPQGDP
jgi:hypothetical protein